MPNKKKEDFYNGIKTVGFVIFIPFLLAAGPLSGYFAGIFLQEKFNLSPYVVLVSVVFGFIIAATEIVKILKIVSKINKR